LFNFSSEWEVIFLNQTFIEVQKPKKLLSNIDEWRDKREIGNA